MYEFENRVATIGDLNEVSRHHFILAMATYSLLMRSGIATPDQIEQQIARSTTQVDQYWQAVKDEKEAEYSQAVEEYKKKNHDLWKQIQLWQKLFGQGMEESE